MTRCHAMFPLCGCGKVAPPPRVATISEAEVSPASSAPAAAPIAAECAPPVAGIEAPTPDETVDPRALGDDPPPEDDLPAGAVVYFIATTDLTMVKIGKTKSLRTRLKDATTMSPKPVALLTTVPGYTAVEAWFHRRFNEQHSHLEWFRLEGELARCISRIKGGLSSADLCAEALQRDGGPAAPPLYALDDEYLGEDEEEILAEMEAIAARLRRADAEAGLRRLSEFVQQAFANTKPNEQLEWGPHLDAVCDHVQQQLEDRARAIADPRFVMRAQNLLINVPPRTLKTFILACAQVWCWLRWPWTNILYLSANPIVVVDSSRVFEGIITSPWFRATYEPTWSIKADHDALTDMGNTLQGTRRSRGLDARITGAGADWLIVDDPHDMKDTDAQIATSVANYDASVHNRINSPRASIRTYIAQRANNPGDLSGHLIDQMVGGGNKVLHLRLPMGFEKSVDCKCGTCDHRQVNAYGFAEWRSVEGDVLHPRFDETFLAGEMIRLNSYGYAAQMQQRPQPKGGGKIKRQYFGWYRLAGEDHLAMHGDVASNPRPEGCVGSRTWQVDNPNLPVPPVYVVEKKRRGIELVYDLDYILVSLDAANKDTKRGSQWGLTAYGGKGPRTLVLDDRTKRGDLNRDIIPQIVDLILKWRPRELIVEDKAAGPSTISMLREMMEAGKIKDAEGNAVACKLTEVSPGAEDKDLRMDAVLGRIEAGLVYLPEGAPWVRAWVEELARWPAAPNDRGDTLSQTLNHKRPTSSYSELVRQIGERARTSENNARSPSVGLA